YTFYQPDTPPCTAVDHGIALFDGILFTKLDGIKLHLFAKLIDGTLQGECGLGSVRGAVCANAHFVRQHLIAMDIDIGAVISAGHKEAAQAGSSSRIRARVKDGLAL